MKKFDANEPYFFAQSLANINEILHSQKDIPQRLQERLKEHFKKPVVLCSSYVFALHLALCALKLKRGDKVLLCVNSHPFLPLVVRYFDAEPIFVDIESKSLNICTNALENTLKTYDHKKLRAMFLSHHAGICANVAEVLELCEKYNVKLINEADIALNLCDEGGKHISDFGQISCFSLADFTPDAPYSAGCMVFNSEDDYKRALLLSNGAINRQENSDLGYFYNALDIGYAYELRTLQAAAALDFLDGFSAAQNARCALASEYFKHLGKLKHISQSEVQKSLHKYIIKVDKNRDLFAKKLSERGIICKIHYIPINFLSYYKQKYSLKITDYPNALNAYQQVLSLPFAPQLDSQDVAFICEQVANLDAEWI